jgi:hypothetical protein
MSPLFHMTLLAPSLEIGAGVDHAICARDHVMS